LDQMDIVVILYTSQVQKKYIYVRLIARDPPNI
jgi:hypothetical protein